MTPDRRRPRRLRAAALLAVPLLAAALSACSGGGSPTPDASVDGQNYVSGDGTITFLAAGQRGEPVALAGESLEGAPIDLTSLRGKVVVLNVWGSWCPPCRKEAPDLQEAYEQLKPQGVEFVGINFRDPDPAPALAFQRTFGITYPSIRDEGGETLLALRGAVSPNAIPSTVVLDTQGRIAARASTAVTTTTLTSLVDDVRGGTTP